MSNDRNTSPATKQPEFENPTLKGTFGITICSFLLGSGAALWGAAAGSDHLLQVGRVMIVIALVFFAGAAFGSSEATSFYKSRWPRPTTDNESDTSSAPDA